MLGVPDVLQALYQGQAILIVITELIKICFAWTKVFTLYPSFIDKASGSQSQWTAPTAEHKWSFLMATYWDSCSTENIS